MTPVAIRPAAPDARACYVPRRALSLKFLARLAEAVGVRGFEVEGRGMQAIWLGVTC